MAPLAQPETLWVWVSAPLVDGDSVTATLSEVPLPVFALGVCDQSSASVLHDSVTIPGPLQIPMNFGICLSMSSKRDFARKIWE